MGADRLTDAARQAIADADNEVWVSAASAWEIAIKRAKGHFEDAPEDLGHQIEQHGFRALPISFAHAGVAGALPPLHGDPFDRMLVAQALTEKLRLVTRDVALGAYGVPTLAA